MEAAIISAISAELMSRLIAFLIKKYKDKTSIADKMERLQELLLRVHAVVEEADGRYVTNSMMLMKLKLIAGSMYRGYHMLDTLKHRSVEDEEAISISFSPAISSFAAPFKRSRLSTMEAMRGTVVCINGLQGVLDDLEAAVANMSEFVVMLGGCERMFRRPFDTYLYTDNFMFGRHVEKQQTINILLQQTPTHLGPDHPMVLPIIGGCRVGKKTLVSHVCNNEQIRSKFPSIMYINGSVDSIRTMESMDSPVKFSNDRTLLVIQFATDIEDHTWIKFYSTYVATMAAGSKVIIISRVQNLARFGTVAAVRLNSLSHQEYRYLFKKLAFGSTDEEEHPQLASLANGLVTTLGGSLITANVIAGLLRRNLDVRFWRRILQRFKGMVDSNLSEYGEHPKDILEKEQPIDISWFASSPSSRLCLMPPRVVSDDDPTARKTHIRMTFGDLIAGCASVKPHPNGEFELVAWESRVPPYTKYVSVAAFAKEEEYTAPTRKRRSSN